MADGRDGPAAWRAGRDVGRAGREALAWAVLAAVDGVGPVTLGALVRACGTGREVLAAATRPRGPEDLVAAARGAGSRLDLAVARAVADAALAADRFAAGLVGLGLSVLTVEMPTYPSRLRSLEMPPPVLFVAGDPAVLDTPSAVAVVGTRHPSERGRRVAAGIGTALGRCGAVVVSGLAVGIDGVAHAAALDAGGRSVAVLGSGHARLYPAAHRALADRLVATGGAVVSELAPDVEPKPGTFPRRNRVIAGLADATVVVEAGAQSGALTTAGWALEQGRGCHVVPGPIDDDRYLGCNRLLRLYPGEVHAVPGIAELLEDLALAPRPERTGTPARPIAGPGLEAVLGTLGPVESAVARAIHPRAATLDELVAATGHPPAALLAVLTRLEDRGLAVPALGRYAAAGDLALAVPPVRVRTGR